MSCSLLIFQWGSGSSPLPESVRVVSTGGSPDDSLSVPDDASAPLIGFVRGSLNLTTEGREQLGQFLNGEGSRAVFVENDRLDDFQPLHLLPASVALRVTDLSHFGLVIGSLPEPLPPSFSAEELASMVVAEAKAVPLRVFGGLEADAVREFALPELAAPCDPAPKWLRDLTRSFDVGTAFPGGRTPDAVSVRAGLLQLQGDLDRSHDDSQSVQHRGIHAAADYWHGIMHRREPDPSNAKYWFRHVGDHPVFDELRAAATDLLSGSEHPDASELLERLTSDGWNPFAFIDAVEDARRGGDDDTITLLMRLQWREMVLLLRSTVADARAS